MKRTVGGGEENEKGKGKRNGKCSGKRSGKRSEKRSGKYTLCHSAIKKMAVGDIVLLFFTTFAAKPKRKWLAIPPKMRQMLPSGAK